jgi:hypothetical protein
MALTKNISISGCYQFAFDGGVATTQTDAILTIPDAYIVAYSVEATKTEARATVHFRGKGVAITKFYTFTPSVESNSSNFIAQAYLYLKTLPEFADAVDC